MSSTEIYVINSDSSKWIGSTRNAWRGAMFVWDQIARDYLNLDSFPFHDEDLQRKVWNAGKYFELKRYENIVLSSTMDYVYITKSGLKDVLEAFKEYGERHPQSSLMEQYEIINSIDLADDECIAFNQTTVCEFLMEDGINKEKGYNIFLEEGDQ